MSKKSRFWRAYEKQHGKRAQTLFKSEPQHLWHIYWSMWRQLNWKKSVLVICKIFWLFANGFTAGHKFSLLNREKLKQPIQMELSKKQKAFFHFCAAFLKCRWNFEHFQKKMTLIADVFPMLPIPKNVVR